MSKDGERIATLEANHKNIMEKVEEILGRFDKLEEKIDSALEKKADKVVVDRILSVAYWVGGIIGTGLLSYLGYLIVKLIEL